MLMARETEKEFTKKTSKPCNVSAEKAPKETGNEVWQQYNDGKDRYVSLEEENRLLRLENKELRLERDMLKQVTARLIKRQK